MPRGGKRTGRPGVRYPNRADLAKGPRALPKTAAPGQRYGEAGQQLASQAAVPMANGPLPPGPPPVAPGPTTQDAISAAQAAPVPNVVPLTAPSNRPNEPVTAGLGNPAPPAPADPLLQGVALLNSLGDSASPEVKALRTVVAAQQANQAAP